MALRFLSSENIDGNITAASGTFVRGTSDFAVRLDSTSSSTDNDLRFAKGGVDYAAIQTGGGSNDLEFFVHNGSSWIESFRVQRNTGNVGIGLSPASSVVLDVKEPDSSNDLILGLTAGTGSRAQIRSVVQTSTESALSFHTTLSSSTQERFRILNTGAFSLGNSGTNYGTAGQVLTSNGNSAPYWSTPTSGTITGSGTSGRLAKFTGTSSIGDSGIIDSSNAVAITINGNEEVGIGTSPFTKLDVYDSSTSVNIIRARNNTQQIALGVNDASGGAFLFVNTNHALRFGCNGSEVARFTADGTLKFPSAVKTKKIELWSTTTNDNQFYGFGVEGSTLVYSVYDVGDSHVFFAGSSSTSRIEIMRVSGNGNVSIGTTANTLARLNVYDTTAGQSTSRVVDISNSVDANINIWLSQSGAATKYAEIASFSTIPLVLNNVSGGNVGIGTTSPSEKLDVGGTVRSSAYEGKVKINSTATNGKQYEFISIDTGNLGLYDGTAYRLWIAGGGNVGIGTTSPGSKLHVSGTGTVARLQSSSSYVDMYLVSSGNTGFLNLGATGMNFYVNGGSASNLHMHISNAGNVGIGTTTPSTKLHIDQPSNDRAGGLYIRRNGSTYGLSAFVNSGGYGVIGSNGSFTTDILTMDLNSGYVGIGVSAPNAKLEVNGDVSIRGGNGLYFGQSTGSLNSWTTRLFSSGSTQYFNAQTFIFNNAGYGSTEFVRFTSGGRVGVGVTNPSARLQVNFDGNNGGGDLTGYGILHQSSASGQATIGAHNTGDGYANLNLSSTVSGAQKLWHISKRPNSNSNRLEYFFYDTTFYSRFIFTYLGDFHADGDVVAYSTTASDEKLKNNIEPIHNALDKVSKLNGVSFTWNCGSRKDEKDLGVIAQNVEKVLPELVREKESPYHDDQTIKTVDYEKLTAVLIEAVKELQQKVEKLENKKCCCK